MSQIPPAAVSHQRSQTEQILASLWVEVLQLKNSPMPVDNFFSLGGDSMAMVVLEYRIQEELPVALPPGALVGAPTLEELCCLVDTLSASFE